jgi:CDP-diacylglycerol--glycerol-3-phosphate 3-phosphatidyltransferase
MAVDLLCSLGMVGASLAIAVAYAGRVSRRGWTHEARIERAGGSALLGRRPMEIAYWALRPLGRALVALGASANAVTWSSLALAVTAGAAIAAGHYGVGAAFMAASSLGDALDGMIARETGTASAAGEVLDAAVDRYAELLFLGGIALEGRSSPALLALAFAATAGAIMVSYSTAKAEALGVTPPRGAMRREERAVYLVLGAALVPVAAAATARWELPGWVGRAPLFLSLGLVAVVGNLSAVRRFRAIAAAVRRPSTTVRAHEDDGRTLARDAHAATSDAMR